MQERPLRIVQIHSADSGGGAEQMALMLHHEFSARGQDSWFLVGRKDLNVDLERTIQTPRQPRYRGELGLRMIPERLLGLQYFSSPSIAGEMWPLKFKPDILLIHSIHGSEGYFRTEDLEWLSAQCPTFLFMHDQWLMTGHCAYTLGCDFWRTGCLRCPDLTVYPALEKDGSRYNWQRKRRVMSSSRLWVGSPAQWLLDLVRESPILGELDQFYVPNAFDPKLFFPGDRQAARRSLGIPQDSQVVLFLAQSAKSRFKDFSTLARAFARIRDLGFKFTLITVGGMPDPEIRAALPPDVLYFEYTTDRQKIADYYRVADLFCLSSCAEVLPLTILESLACGTPVIASDVGGVSEVVIPGKTGWLVPPKDESKLVETVIMALSDQKSLMLLREKAVAFSSDFVIEKIASKFLSLFRARLNECDPTL